MIKNDITRFIDSIKIYDYDEATKKEKIQSIKEDFCKKCQKDITLSDEYKQFVSNLDNISVELEYVEGFDMILRWVKIDASYSVTYTSYVTTGYTGTSSVNSSGDVVTKFSPNVESSEYTKQYKDDYTFYPEKAEVFEVKNYDNFDKSEMIELKENDSMPTKLRNLYTIGVQSTSVDKAVNDFSKVFDGKVKSKIESYHSNDKMSSISTRASDYCIDRMNVVYYPKGHNLTVVYKDKEYKTKDTNAVGEKSEKYNEYISYRSHLSNGWQIAAIVLSVIVNLALGMWTCVHVREYEYCPMDWTRIVLVIYTGLQIFGLYKLYQACDWLPGFADLPLEELKSRASKEHTKSELIVFSVSFAFTIVPIVMFLLCVIFNTITA